MKIKKLVIPLLILTMLLTLSSCGDSEAVADKDGKMLNLTIDEIYEQSNNGFYVTNADKTLSPVMSVDVGYQGSANESSASRFIWYTNNQYDISGLIPVVKKGKNKLVMVYSTAKDMPSVYTLEKYDFKGYTVGTKFQISSDKQTMNMFTNNPLSGSSMDELLSSEGLDESVEIDSINNKETLPLSNVNPNTGILEGLQKNKLYNICFYNGTYAKSIDAVADTLIFNSSKMITLQNAYKKITKGYFEIMLPENLKDGFYYVCDVGLFKYEG